MQSRSDDADFKGPTSFAELMARKRAKQKREGSKRTNDERVKKKSKCFFFTPRLVFELLKNNFRFCFLYYYFFFGGCFVCSKTYFFF